MSFTIWFTGLSGAGKTTLSRLVFEAVGARGVRAELLDGDVFRQHLSKDLGFDRKSREINIRRLGFVSRLLNKHDVVSIVAAIAPYAAARMENRRQIPVYVEVFCDCPLDVLVRRDPKGLYARAKRGEIAHFTGISSEYERPENPDIHLRTDRESAEESFQKVLQGLRARGLIVD
jgi:adenylylsulfate kinase